MKTYLCISDRQVALEDHLSKARTLIPLGRKSEEAYNVLALEDTALDTFQCQFSCTEAGWKINDGQWRTDCPKGILSRLQHACNLCMGRCVNTHPGRPTYGWRMPQKPTMLNGQSIRPEGVILKDGDIITVGRTHMQVMVKN